MIETMYERLLQVACGQSKAGIRNASIHDDTEVEITILADGRVCVTVAEDSTVPFRDWNSACVLLAIGGNVAINTATNQMTFRPI